MDARIRLTRQTVNAMQERLRGAYHRGDIRLVRRISSLLEHFIQHTPISELSERRGFSVACFYVWINELLLEGLDNLVYHHAGGRPPRLTKTQKQRLCELIDAGPQAAGFETACWSVLLIQELIRREFGVLYNRYYVCELLRNLGYSFQKAQFVSDHLDEVRRQAWLTQEWPQILREARRRNAWILFGDEVSFPHLWRKTKKQATHNKYFEQFAEIISSVEKASNYFAQHAAELLGLFGRYCDETGIVRQLPA